MSTDSLNPITLLKELRDTTPITMQRKKIDAFFKAMGDASTRKDEDTDAGHQQVATSPASDYTVISHEAKSGAKCPSVFGSEISVIEEEAYTVAMNFISETIMKASQLSDKMKGSVIDFADAAIKCYASVTDQVSVSLEKCASAARRFAREAHPQNDDRFERELIKAVLESAKEQGAKFDVKY